MQMWGTRRRVVLGGGYQRCTNGKITVLREAVLLSRFNIEIISMQGEMRMYSMLTDFLGAVWVSCARVIRRPK